MRLQVNNGDYPIHIEVAPRIHLVRGAGKSRFPEANCLLIDDDILTLVDVGANLNHITQSLKDLGHQLQDVDRIVLTHFHVDHKNHAETIRKISNCEVLCNPLGEKGTSSLEGLLECYGIKGHKYYPEWEYFLRKWIPAIFEEYVVTGFYQDGKTISCGETELIPIFTPGHTHDHTCFGINGTDIVFLVDIDLTSFGPWYGNRVSDINDFEKSINRLIELEPQVGISSHLIDPIDENVIGKLEDYRAELHKRDERIITLIERGVNSITKLVEVPVIYPKIPRKVFLIFEEIMIKKHVERLIRNGVIERDKDVLRVCK